MSRKWGQHFLKDRTYIDQALEAAELDVNTPILEIGPGQGVLTEALLETSASVTAIEIDPKLYRHLQNRFDETSTLRVLHSDVLELSDEELLRLFEKRFKVVANLPYQVTSPIFFKLFRLRQYIESITVMIQKEVAVRLVATHTSGKEYGPLSVAAEIGFERRLVCDVPPHAFTPPPKVMSSIVHLESKSEASGLKEEGVFLRWVQQLFQQRRKTLLNNLKQTNPTWFTENQEKLQQQFGKSRPENLSPEDFIQLYQTINGML